MPQNQTLAQLSIPARVSFVVLLAGLTAAYFILSASVTRKAEDVLARDWAVSGAVLATIVRDGLAASLNNGQEIGRAFDQGAYREAMQHAGAYSGLALLAPDHSIASWSAVGTVPDMTDLASFSAVDATSGSRGALGEFLAGDHLTPYRLVSAAGDELPFNLVSANVGANGWTVMLFEDRQAASELAGQVRLSQTLSFMSLALLLLLLLLGFYVSLASALSTAVRSAAGLEEAGRRFEERAGAMRAPLTRIQGLADMLVLTEDPDERNNYLAEIKDETRKLSAELQVYQGIFGR